MSIILEPLANVAMFLTPVALYYIWALLTYAADQFRTKQERRRRSQLILLRQQQPYKF